MLQGLAKHTKVKDLLDKTVELTGSHQQTSTDSTITIQNHLKTIVSEILEEAVMLL